MFKMASKILLGNIFGLSLSWLSLAASLWMQKRSTVFRRGFFSGNIRFANVLYGSESMHQFV
jgi:hypothetical protein